MRTRHYIYILYIAGFIRFSFQSRRGSDFGHREFGFCQQNECERNGYTAKLAKGEFFFSLQNRTRFSIYL